MKAIWNGTISFGLVSIPIQLFSASKPSKLSFSMMDSKDHAKIEYKRVNANTGKEVAWDDIVKSYEFDDGSFVVVTDEDFEKADPKASKTMEIEQFIDADELNLMLLEKPYFLSPVKGGEKPYILLRDAMKKSDKVAIGRITIRTKQSLGVIFPKDDALVLNLLLYADEIRSSEALDLPKEIKVTKKEMDLAISLIDGLTAKWKHEDFEDDYSNALLERIQAKAKLKGESLPDDEETEVEETSTNVVDIMDLLKQSIAAKDKKPSQSSQSTAKSKSKTAKQSKSGGKTKSSANKSKES